MGRKAITLEKQLELLRSRGMIIDNPEKAKEVLLDIGYYRLGFYWFPFEKTYPSKRKRNHQFKEGTHFQDAVTLYYFDYKLRSILSFYIQRIEINFRTYLTYTLSNAYQENPQWFVDKKLVDQNFIDKFDTTVYTSSLKLNSVIKNHHRKYREDKYAPAWKTLEYMTFGSVINLYRSLLDKRKKIDISQHYGIRYVEILDNYLEVIRELRNYCAHGNVLFDFVPFKYIRKGPANVSRERDFRNLNGAIAVILYMLKQVSETRYRDMIEDISKLIDHYSNSSKVAEILTYISGLEKSKLK